LNWKVLELVFFVGDVISGVGLGIFSQGYWALGSNGNHQFFDSSFYWKLGYNPTHTWDVSGMKKQLIE